MRSALVTGASRGIGFAIAASLARQGYALTITSRDPEQIAAVADRLHDLGAPAVAHRAADMADHHALAELVALHAERFGTMRALVLSAGVGTAGSVADLPQHRLRKMVEVNLIAPTLLVQAALPLLRASASAEFQQGAKVVALSSITGLYAERGLAGYGATKAALLSLVDTLNAEESAGGVSATAIAPGFVATDMSAWTTDTIPAATMIQVADVVGVVDMVLGLSRHACISRIVVTRSGSSGYEA